MFGTLRYSPEKDDTEFIGVSSPGVLDDHGPGKPVCDRCRLKKVWSSPNILRVKLTTSIHLFSRDAVVKMTAVIGVKGL